MRYARDRSVCTRIRACPRPFPAALRKGEGVVGLRTIKREAWAPASNGSQKAPKTTRCCYRTCLVSSLGECCNPELRSGRPSYMFSLQDKGGYTVDVMMSCPLEHRGYGTPYPAQPNRRPQSCSCDWAHIDAVCPSSACTSERSTSTGANPRLGALPTSC